MSGTKEAGHRAAGHRQHSNEGIDRHGPALPLTPGYLACLSVMLIMHSAEAQEQASPAVPKRPLPEEKVSSPFYFSSDTITPDQKRSATIVPGPDLTKRLNQKVSYLPEKPIKPEFPTAKHRAGKDNDIISLCKTCYQVDGEELDNVVTVLKEYNCIPQDKLQEGQEVILPYTVNTETQSHKLHYFDRAGETSLVWIDGTEEDYESLAQQYYQLPEPGNSDFTPIEEDFKKIQDEISLLNSVEEKDPKQVIIPLYSNGYYHETVLESLGQYDWFNNLEQEWKNLCVDIAARSNNTIFSSPVLEDKMQIDDIKRLICILDQIDNDAKLALGELLDNGELLGIHDRSGEIRLIDAFYDFSAQAYHPDFNFLIENTRSHVFSELVSLIASPKFVTDQGQHGGCTHTGIYFLMAVNYPVEFIYLAKGLTSGSGQVQLLHEDITIRTEETSREPTDMSENERGDLQRVMHAAAMLFASEYMGKTYINKTDTTITPDGEVAGAHMIDEQIVFTAKYLLESQNELLKFNSEHPLKEDHPDYKLNQSKLRRFIDRFSTEDISNEILTQRCQRIQSTNPKLIGGLMVIKTEENIDSAHLVVITEIVKDEENLEESKIYFFDPNGANLPKDTKYWNAEYLGDGIWEMPLKSNNILYIVDVDL